MSVTTQITSELAPFFKYATSDNPSKVIRSWKDRVIRTSTHRVYQNCVSCNVKRINLSEVPYLSGATDAYFCGSCFSKVAKIVKRYESLSSDHDKALNSVWDDNLFQPRYSTPCLIL